MEGQAQLCAYAVHDTEAAVLWSASSDVTPCHAGQYTTSMAGLAVMDDKCLMARQLMGLPTGLPPTYCLPEDLHRFLVRPRPN